LEAVGVPLRKEALEQWGDWLSKGWDWSWFVTLTFDPKRATHGTRNLFGWAATDRAWYELLAEVEGAEGARQGLAPHTWWVRGREPHHGYGGTHFHALIGGLSPAASRRDAWSWWKDRYGINRIEPYDPSRGAAHYLTKYVVKQLGDVTFSPELGAHRKKENGNGG
jgi:hypothetical protein